MSKTVLTERDGYIATVTLNRPEKLNALTMDMWGQLGDTFRELSTDNSLRCIVLRGAGGKAFSPGNDISEFARHRSTPEQGKAYGAVMHNTIAAIRDCPQPTVALIEGICVGGGLEIACLCDIRVCSQSSRFGAPINKLGLVMAYAEIDVLMSLVGRSAAMEILLEGQIFGADKAKELGLVTHVVPDAEVEMEGYTSAQRIAEGAPLVARWHKIFARRLADPKPLTSAELDEAYACFGTEDFQIGYQAFLAKKKPAFIGR